MIFSVFPLNHRTAPMIKSGITKNIFCLTFMILSEKVSCVLFWQDYPDKTPIRCPLQFVRKSYIAGFSLRPFLAKEEMSLCPELSDRENTCLREKTYNQYIKKKQQ